ncbi:DUF4138 domain-containing protein [Christiangramia sp. LLG6405-1]|uniref:DUF4138 domain-containing protein n=1 Tax=Christiangramia sp. LLG6405-1 TaxID=3160832 RepID=UPI0038669264
MKKYIAISVFIVVSALSNAQNRRKLDTIYANDQKNTALFFPQPITQGITGSTQFVFTYNREKQQNFGLLQATPGEESNLLVICGNSIYSYIVKYKKQLSRLNYFITESESIGNLKSTSPISKEQSEPKKNVTNKENHYKKYAAFLLSKKQRKSSLNKRNQGVVLSIENIVFNTSELYFVIQVSNESSLDFDLNFLNLSIQTRQRGKRTSVQTLLEQPILQYNVPALIKADDTKRFVYVFSKFSISKDQKAVLELNEKNGARNVALKISHRSINNPD